MLVERPDVCGSLLREVLELVAAGSLRPLPREVYPISAAGSAFHQMAQAKHIGKLVLSLADPTARIEPARPPGASAMPVRADGSYLISGGLGGLGLTVARWLVAQGARHLVLLGRRGAGASVAPGG